MKPTNFLNNNYYRTRPSLPTRPKLPGPYTAPYFQAGSSARPLPLFDSRPKVPHHAKDDEYCFF